MLEVGEEDVDDVIITFKTKTLFLGAPLCHRRLTFSGADECFGSKVGGENVPDIYQCSDGRLLGCSSL